MSSLKFSFLLFALFAQVQERRKSVWIVLMRENGNMKDLMHASYFVVIYFVNICFDLFFSFLPFSHCLPHLVSHSPSYRLKLGSTSNSVWWAKPFLKGPGLRRLARAEGHVPCSLTKHVSCSAPTCVEGGQRHFVLLLTTAVARSKAAFSTVDENIH